MKTITELNESKLEKVNGGKEDRIESGNIVGYATDIKSSFDDLARQTIDIPLNNPENVDRNK